MRIKVCDIRDENLRITFSDRIGSQERIADQEPASGNALLRYIGFYFFS